MKNTKFLLIPALCLFSGLAFAGFTQPSPVTIDFDLGIASGDMVSARNSKNKFEFIGCGIRAYDDGAGSAFYSGFCQAGLEEVDEETPEAETVTCFTTNIALLEGINIVSDSSYITFSWSDDGAGNLTCTRIGSSTQSFYLEKGKLNK